MKSTALGSVVLVFLAGSAAFAQPAVEFLGGPVNGRGTPSTPDRGLTPALNEALGLGPSEGATRADSAGAVQPATVASSDVAPTTTRAPAAPAARPDATGLRRHTVRRGEDAMRIAAQYGVTTPELMLQNGLPAGDPILTVGSELVIPNVRPKRTLATDQADGSYHWVQEGDAPIGVARRYGVRLDALLAENPSLQSRPRLLAGHLLKLPSTADTSSAECVATTQGPCVHGGQQAARPAPAAEQPAAEQPVAEQPVAEQPVAEQPVAEQPAAEQPVVERALGEPVPAATAPVTTSTPAPVAATLPESTVAPATTGSAKGGQAPTPPPAAVTAPEPTATPTPPPAVADAPLPRDANPAWRSPWDGPTEDSPWHGSKWGNGAVDGRAPTVPPDVRREETNALGAPQVLGRSSNPPQVEWLIQNDAGHTVEISYSGLRSGVLRLQAGQSETLVFPRGGPISVRMTVPNVILYGKPVRPFAGQFTFEDGTRYGHRFFIYRLDQPLPPGAIPSR